MSRPTARAAGIDPADPKQWQAADKFAIDQMSKSLSPWKGDPAYAAYLKTGKAPDMAYLMQGAPGASGMTINTSGPAGAPAPTAVAGGPPAPAGGGGLAGSLPGFTPDSPGAKMTAQGLQSLAGGDGQQEQPPQMSTASAAPPAMASGGLMMLGPGGQNTFGQRAAQQALAQQGARRAAIVPHLWTHACVTWPLRVLAVSALWPGHL